MTIRASNLDDGTFAANSSEFAEWFLKKSDGKLYLPYINKHSNRFKATKLFVFMNAKASTGIVNNTQLAVSPFALAI